MTQHADTMAQAVAMAHTGDFNQAARLAYQAAFQAVCQKAQQFQHPCNDDEDAVRFVRWLDDRVAESEPILYLNGEPPLPLLRLTGGFLNALAFKQEASIPSHNAAWKENPPWTPEEFDFYLPAIACFVDQLLATGVPEARQWTA